MTRTDPGLTLRLKRNFLTSSSESKATAGPEWRSMAGWMPLCWTTAPLGARFPKRMARHPSFSRGASAGLMVMPSGSGALPMASPVVAEKGDGQKVEGGMGRTPCGANELRRVDKSRPIEQLQETESALDQVHNLLAHVSSLPELGRFKR